MQLLNKKEVCESCLHVNIPNLVTVPSFLQEFYHNWISTSILSFQLNITVNLFQIIKSLLQLIIAWKIAEKNKYILS